MRDRAFLRGAAGAGIVLLFALIGYGIWVGVTAAVADYRHLKADHDQLHQVIGYLNAVAPKVNKLP